MPLNVQQARVIDPVLTQIAQGYKNNEFVGGSLFPTVPVSMRAGNIITFGKEDFMQYATARAPGENTKRVTFGRSSSPFALVDYSLEGALPLEVRQEAMDAANGFTVDEAAIALRKVKSIMDLRLEIAQAAAATNASNYNASNKVTLSGTSQFSDLSNSDPIGVIETAKDAIRQKTGKYPNVLVMGPQVLKALRQHTKIIDRTKYTGRDVPTTDLLASLFGVSQVIVGGAIQATDAGVFSDVWGKSVVLAYTTTESLANLGTPTFGYTYQHVEYPLAEEPYYDRNAKTWYFPYSRCEAPVITAPDAGYLISAAVA